MMRLLGTRCAARHRCQLLPRAPAFSGRRLFSSTTPCPDRFGASNDPASAPEWPLESEASFAAVVDAVVNATGEEARDGAEGDVGDEGIDSEPLPPAVPPNWTVTTDFALARFVARGTAPTGERLVVQCDAGCQRRFAATSDAGRDREAALAAARASRPLRLPRCVRRSPESLACDAAMPVVFSVLVLNAAAAEGFSSATPPTLGSSSSSSSTSLPSASVGEGSKHREGANDVVPAGLCLELLAASVGAGTLALDGAVFHNDPSSVLDDSLDAWDAAREAYQGPQLQQRGLAQVVCQVDGGAVNPFSSAAAFSVAGDPRHERSDFLTYRGAETKHTRFGHQPVHTVPPVLYDAIARYAMDLGVNDGLALFVHRHARYVQKTAQWQWSRDLRSVFRAGSSARTRSR